MAGHTALRLLPAIEFKKTSGCAALTNSFLLVGEDSTMQADGKPCVVGN
jgi:hypothetical protein